MFEKLWNWFKPNPKPTKQRRYEGARYSRLDTDWFTSGTSADSEIFSSLRKLRNRTRQVIRDYDYALNALRIINNNVIGKGITLQGQIKRQRKVEGHHENDDRLNNLLESAWNSWCNKKNCDVTGQQHFSDLQKLILSAIATDGEVLIRLVKDRFGESPVPLGLEVIEADQLADDYNGSHNGNLIKMGIEFDKWHRPTAYWLYDYHPGDYQFITAKVGKRDIRRVPAEEIRHYYLKNRPSQSRGVTWFHACLQRVRNIGEYETAEIVASRAAASYMGFRKTPDGDLTDGDEGDNIEHFEPGMIGKLAPGEDFVAFDPSRPNQAFEPFTKMMLRGIAAGTGTPYPAISKNYADANYSSIRQELVDTRDHWEILQHWFAANICQEIYEEWLDMAVLSGVLPFSDYELNPERFTKVRWMYRGWSWVDPEKEIKSVILALNHGLTTYTKEAAKQGEDFEEMLKTIAKEKKMAENYGVQIYLPFGGSDSKIEGSNAFEETSKDASLPCSDRFKFLEWNTLPNGQTTLK